MNENDKPPINFTEPLYPSLKASAPIEEETPDFEKLLQTSRYNELKKTNGRIGRIITSL